MLTVEANVTKGRDKSKSGCGRKRDHGLPKGYTTKCSCGETRPHKHLGQNFIDVIQWAE